MKKAALIFLAIVVLGMLLSLIGYIQNATRQAHFEKVRAEAQALGVCH